NPSHRVTPLVLSQVIREEAEGLPRAGACSIQFDEPSLSTRPDELHVAIEAMQIVTDGLKAKTISHMCFGDFDTIYPSLLELPVQQLDLEAANNDFALIELIRKHPFTKEIALGVVDSHDHRIETKDEVVAGMHRALEVLRPEQAWIDPDCGLKTRSWKEP